MRRKGERSKGNNWLLIKHRHGFEREGDGALLAQDRSVASGRSMQQIAAGKGRGPRPFMEAGEPRADPRAQWSAETTANGTGKPEPRPSAAPRASARQRGRRLSGAGRQAFQADKELWPATQESKPFSKLDLARYLEAVGPWMLEHIGGRPCSILRAPDGINAERFFQRHAMPGLSKLITLTPLAATLSPTCRLIGSRP
jgi:bifunctional non-homologous end joining protein LigD